LHVLVVLSIQTLHFLEDRHFAFAEWGSSILVDSANRAGA
jgi:hypothetical protein